VGKRPRAIRRAAARAKLKADAKQQALEAEGRQVIRTFVKNGVDPGALLFVDAKNCHSHGISVEGGPGILGTAIDSQGIVMTDVVMRKARS
jgi:hypothetical protein